MAKSNWDPKGLISESYKIENITDSQCRTIFLDWALSLSAGQETSDALYALLDLYRTEHPDHPMTGILKQGVVQMTRPKRRGGWRSRERG